MHMIQS